MDINTEVKKFDVFKYQRREVDPNPSNNSNALIKYIAPRVVGHTLSKNLQGSYYGPTWSSLAPSHNTLSTTTTVGLASLSQTSPFTTVSAIHSINGDRIIDELRELSKLTELLGNVILQCCSLETHIRAQKLQIEWLQTHQSTNASIIQKMYLNEMDSAKKILQTKYKLKVELETKIKEIRETTVSNEEQYQHILNRRTAYGKEILDSERHIAENNAEVQFLQRRIRHLDEESRYYVLRNQSLEDRKARLRYELDEDHFSNEALKLEMEMLENEKITSEDIRANALDDAHNTFDISQLPAMQPSKTFHELLNAEVQRIRAEYETKIESFREELHRKFELDLHRYQVQKVCSGGQVTREHELKLEMYQNETQEVSQQISVFRGKIDETIHQIEIFEKQIFIEKSDQNSLVNQRKSLAALNGMIHDREQQVAEAFRIRAILKQQIDNYKGKLNRYPKQLTQSFYTKRPTSAEFSHLSALTDTQIDRSTPRLSMQELNTYHHHQEDTSGMNSSLPRPSTSIIENEVPIRTSFIQVKEFWEEGTLTGTSNFNINQDCQDLHRLLAESNIDELSIIRILCNRNISQRLQIRDKYRILFNRNLGDTIEMIPNQSLNKLLRILLLSSVEHDCYELRRILKGSNFDEIVLVEILFTRTNSHLRAMKETYQRLFQSTLEQDVSNDRDNEMKRILLTLCRTSRPEENDVDDNIVYKDARNLYETSSQWRTEGSSLLRLLCYRSNAQLKQIFNCYHQYSSIDIEEAIKVHIDSSLYYIYMAIVRVIRNRSRFFAYELKKSIKGAATNEDNLNRIVVSRCEIDMVQIKSEYEKIAKRTLYTHIQADIEGSYRVALLELLRQRFDLRSRNTISSQPVQWRQPVDQYSSQISRVVTRNVSDPKSNGRNSNGISNGQRRARDGESIDQNSELRMNNITPIDTKLAKLQYAERRSFIPTAIMEEGPSTSSHYDE